ncbi:RNA 2',3'-cyclic phosphodiesterase [Thermobifida halotolerans]|uniref:RNA 2',3'-cyclic phosphodiesterase n=2 Tax=Thermobifida halotolerans TaxID=483545 RepID=A0A399G0V0_9ACTN|nr:RNA 2',3'-cyclic phosphodiesterase [Thermobifida halotolerans]
MRLFTAVVPPAAALDELSAAVESARPTARSLRWTPREQWHVTLLFLGEVPDEQVDTVAGALSRVVARHPAMTLSLTGGGTFPTKPVRSHVLWAGLGGDTEELTALATDLRDAAAELGVPVEKRRFTPHVTVARARITTNLTAPRARLDALATDPWEAGEVHLVRSRLGGTPRYQTIATWELA